MNKVQRTMLSAYLSMKNKFDEFMKKEDGMETVQAIILVVVGLIIVAFLIGLVRGNIFPAIEEKLSEILGE